MVKQMKKKKATREDVDRAISAYENSRYEKRYRDIGGFTNMYYFGGYTREDRKDDLKVKLEKLGYSVRIRLDQAGHSTYDLDQGGHVRTYEVWLKKVAATPSEKKDPRYLKYTVVVNMEEHRPPIFSMKVYQVTEIGEMQRRRKYPGEKVDAYYDSILHAIAAAKKVALNCGAGTRLKIGHVTYIENYVVDKNGKLKKLKNS